MDRDYYMEKGCCFACKDGLQQRSSMENWNGKDVGCLCTECKCSKCIHLHYGDCQKKYESFSEMQKERISYEKCSCCEKEASELYTPTEFADGPLEKILLKRLESKYFEICKKCIFDKKGEVEEMDKDPDQIRIDGGQE